MGDIDNRQQVSKEVMGLIADFRPNNPPKVRQHKIILRYTKAEDGNEFFSMTDPLRGNHDRSTVCRTGYGGRGAMSEEEKKPVPVEIEGGGSSWWYVCDECHGAVDTKDKTCPHCKSHLDWSGALWNRISQ